MLEVGARTGDAKPPFRGLTPVLVASSQTTNPVCLALYLIAELRRKGWGVLGLDNGKQKAFSTRIRVVVTEKTTSKKKS